MTTADLLLLHPVRLRIVQAFLGSRQLTTGQLGELLPDVATTTLYRQVAALAEAGVLEVAGERRVRAVTERTYRLRTETTDIGSEEVARWSPEQHRQAFTALVAGLLADFDRYLGRDDVEPGHDEDIRQTAVHLTREEMRQLVDELTAVVARYRARSPEGRTRRLLTTVLLPAG